MLDTVTGFLSGIPITQYVFWYLVVAAVLVFVSLADESSENEKSIRRWRRRPLEERRRAEPGLVSRGCLGHLLFAFLMPIPFAVGLAVLLLPIAFLTAFPVVAWLALSGLIYVVRAALYAGGGGKQRDRLTLKYAAAALLYGGVVVFFLHAYFTRPVVPSDYPPYCPGDPRGC
jgi:hypothetical protein